MLKLKGLLLLTVIFLGLHSSNSFQNCLLSRNTVIETTSISSFTLFGLIELFLQSPIKHFGEGVLSGSRERGVRIDTYIGLRRQVRLSGTKAEKEGADENHS
uniref:Uncharacterized protein n=1 Tax=Rhizophora mucronata TaxID=61149 RepID=A0A2P2IS37_RHIMU